MHIDPKDKGIVCSFDNLIILALLPFVTNVTISDYHWY